MKAQGRLVSKMKKWFTIGVVFALSMSLTSCSRRPANNLNAGINKACGIGSTMGLIDVYTIPVTGQAGMYKIVLMPIQMDVSGDRVSITFYNSSTLRAWTTVEQVGLENDVEQPAGVLSEDQLNEFDKIAIISAHPGQDFLEATPEKEAICDVPFAGTIIE